MNHKWLVSTFLIIAILLSPVFSPNLTAASRLAYSTYLGGSKEDSGEWIDVDTDGNAYVCGWTKSIDFPTTPGAYRTWISGSKDAYVCKLDSTGDYLIFSTFLGGSRRDEAGGIRIDGSGDVYVSGICFSIDFPTTPGAFDTIHNGVEDAFLVKLDTDGSRLIYSTYLGGSDEDTMDGFDIDTMGFAYISGITSSDDFPITPGVPYPSPLGEEDAFISKLNQSGSDLIYSTYFGGSQYDGAHDAAVDFFGQVYVAGSTRSNDLYTTPGCHDSSYNGETDLFCAKISADGKSILASTYLGGSDTDYSRGMDIDTQGNPYLTGETYSIDFPTTPGAFDTRLDIKPDVIVCKLRFTNLALLYATFLGGTDTDDWSRIEVDLLGHAHVTGKTSSRNFPTTPLSHLPSYSRFGGIFVSKLSIDGSMLLFSSVFGGSSDDLAHGIAVDLNGDIYLHGYTRSNDFPTTTHAFDTSFNYGIYDAFVSKIDLDYTSAIPLVQRWFLIALLVLMTILIIVFR